MYLFRIMYIMLNDISKTVAYTTLVVATAQQPIIQYSSSLFQLSDHFTVELSFGSLHGFTFFLGAIMACALCFSSPNLII